MIGQSAPQRNNKPGVFCGNCQAGASGWSIMAYGIAGVFAGLAAL
jgi:hypothetical protein